MIDIIEDKILGSIYGLIIGDVLGEPFEGLTMEEIRKSEIDLGDRIEYTDDSILSLIVASSLIRKKGVNITDIAASLLKNRDYIPKMGPTTLSAISRLEKGNLNYFSKEGTTNGAAMRAPPIGWIIESKNLKNLCNKVYLSSSITHGISVAISGACAIAGAVSTAIDGYGFDQILENALHAADIGGEFGIKDDLSNRLLKNRMESLLKSNKITSSIETADTVPIVFKMLSEELGFKETLVNAVSLGGDTDTIAAMTGSIMGARVGLGGIPSSWKEKVDRLNILLTDGRPDLIEIGEKLTEIREKGLDTDY